MPGTHLLPPNLPKLFAPRPPLPYQRPLDRDIDRVRPKNVHGVGEILQRLRVEEASKPHDENMEEGEEPNFTLAEEVKRQIRREERKKKKSDEFRIAKETCVLSLLSRASATAYLVCLVFLQTNPLTTRRPSVIHTRHFS